MSRESNQDKNGSNEQQHTKAINFDLDTNALRKYYPDPSNWRNAYKDIKKFMLNNGFTWRQWSGYKSVAEVDYIHIYNLADKLAKEFEWLKDCLNKLDVTDITSNYDLCDYIKSTAEEALSLTVKVKEQSKGRNIQDKTDDLLGVTPKPKSEDFTNEPPCAKAVNFDLDTNALQKYYPDPSNWRNAYKDIKSFMLDNGFTWRQWSGYKSVAEVDYIHIYNLADKLAEKYTWLKDCLNRFDVTDIKDEYSLREYVISSIEHNLMKQGDSVSKANEKSITKESDKGVKKPNLKKVTTYEKE